MKKGFTLLEMIIVISVLSILFLLTVPNIQNVMKIVDKKGCDALIKVVDSAVLQYKLDYDELPSDIYDLVNADLISEKQIECNDGKQIHLADGQAYAE